VLAALAVFSYVLWFRAHGIGDALWFRGDQVRDWARALGPFADLPRSGVPSSAGGTTLAPHTTGSSGSSRASRIRWPALCRTREDSASLRCSQPLTLFSCSPCSVAFGRRCSSS
jgi:hypothetical protein